MKHCAIASAVEPAHFARLAEHRESHRQLGMVAGPIAVPTSLDYNECAKQLLLRVSFEKLCMPKAAGVGERRLGLCLKENE